MGRRDFVRDDWPRAMHACGLVHSRITTRDRWSGQKKPVTSMPHITPPQRWSEGIMHARISAAEGTELAQIVPYSRRIAASLGLADVWIEPLDGHAKGNIYFIRRLPWPTIRHWQPPESSHETRVDFATDQLGRRIGLPLMNVSFLIAASKGGGKSALQFSLAASAACRRDVLLVGIDPKGTEMQFWDRRFSMIADTPDDAIRLLRTVTAEMERRYRELKRLRSKGFDRPTEQFPAIWVQVDEAREVLDPRMFGPWATTAAESGGLISLLAQKGRAAGISVQLATQHPRADVIQTTLRSQLLNRWCGITEGPNQTETVLGKDAAYLVETKTLRPGTGWYQREGSPSLPLILVDWIDEKRADKVDETTANLRPEWPEVDALRTAGTFNPAPKPAPETTSTAPQPVPDSDVSDDVSVFDAVCLVAELAGRNPAEIYDLSTVISAVGVAAEAVEYDPERRSQLEAAVDLLSAHFSRP